jgi:hypothetical protein
MMNFVHRWRFVSGDILSRWRFSQATICLDDVSSRWRFVTEILSCYFLSAEALSCYVMSVKVLSCDVFSAFCNRYHEKYRGWLTQEGETTIRQHACLVFWFHMYWQRPWSELLCVTVELANIRLVHDLVTRSWCVRRSFWKIKIFIYNIYSWWYSVMYRRRLATFDVVRLFPLSDISGL